jgi:hypothetical protein
MSPLIGSVVANRQGVRFVVVRAGWERLDEGASLAVVLVEKCYHDVDARGSEYEETVPMAGFDKYFAPVSP